MLYNNRYIKIINWGLLLLSVIIIPVFPVSLLIAIIWVRLGLFVSNKIIFLNQNLCGAIIALLLAGYKANPLLHYLHYINYFNYSLAQFQTDLHNKTIWWIIPLQVTTISNLVLLGIKRKLPPPQSIKADLSLTDGTLIGNEVRGSTPMIISDTELNGHVYVGGTTGSGKTVTLKNFILSAIERGIPLIYVDGKADQRLPLEIQEMCNNYGRGFKLFEMSATSQVKYNPLAIGGFTELKDKIITLKGADSSASKFYQTAEGEYLQFVFKVLLQSGKYIDLHTLGRYINMPNLFDLVGELGDTELQKEARELKSHLADKLEGLVGDINTFIKSEIGHLFECKPEDTVINLDEDIKANNILYFSLNDLNYPDYANRLGKLVINDLKSVFGRINENSPIKTIPIFI